MSRRTLGANFGLDPGPYHVKALPTVGLEHHEMTVAENAAVLQLHVLYRAARLLQEFDGRRRCSSRGLCGHDRDRNALQVLQLARRLGLQLVGLNWGTRRGSNVPRGELRRIG